MYLTIGLNEVFHLRTSVYHLRTLIPTFAHDSAYHLHNFFTPQQNLEAINVIESGKSL